MRVWKQLAQETLNCKTRSSVLSNSVPPPSQPQTTFLFFISCHEGEEAAIRREIRRFKSRLE